MNPTLRYWFQIFFSAFSLKQDKGTKYIIYDAHKFGDRTTFCHEFNVIKKPCFANSVSWKARFRKPKKSVVMTLSQLQEEMEEGQFSKFILFLINERIKKTEKNKNSYWEQESDPFTDPVILKTHILERIATHRNDSSELPKAA